MGYSVIDFANDVLHLKLYPWQEWLLVHALELSPNGGFRFRTLVILIARQNGKSTLAQVLTLWALYVLGVGLIVGTAQDLDIAEELWGDCVDLAEENPDLAQFIDKVNKTNGKKSLDLTTGPRYKVKASTRKGGRGLSSDLILLDELREHTNWDAWGAITKTTMARPRAQVWTLSNAGDALSVVLMQLRRKAHAALGDPDGINLEIVEIDPEGLPPEDLESDDSVGIFEWSAAPGRAKWDRDGWCEANPALGYGMVTEQALAAACATDPEPVFRTECLCQWILGTLEGPFPNGNWEKCADLAGEVADPSDVSFCVDVAVDRSTAWIGVCGSQASGRPQVEIATGRTGGGWLKWVPAWFQEMIGDDPSDDESEWVRVAVASRGMNPSAGLVEPLKKIEGLKVIEWAGSDMSIASGMLYDRVMAVEKGGLEPLAHRSQEALNLAAATAAQRMSGDGWYWDRRNSPQDAAPLVAVTGALWDHLRIREEETESLYETEVLELI